MRDMFEGDDDLLRRYLLGELSEEETERLEPRLLEDDRLLEQAEAVEEDLLAEYAQGELSAEQEREVRSRLIATEDGRARLAMVRSLHRIANEPSAERERMAEVITMPRVSRRPSWYTSVSALAAALLLSVVGLAVWPGLQGRLGEPPPAEEIRHDMRGAVIRTPTPDSRLGSEEPAGQQPAEQQPGKPAVEAPGGAEVAPPPREHRPQPAIVEVPLRSAQRGGEGEVNPSMEVPKEAEQILFRVPLREEGFTSFRIVLVRPDGSEENFPDLQRLPAGKGVEFSVQAAKVSEGFYRIEVYGITASGESERVGDQDFELRRR